MASATDLEVALRRVAAGDAAGSPGRRSLTPSGEAVY